MRILLDHNMPRPLRRALRGHVVLTTQHMQWADLSNGVLMAAAAKAGFQLLLTVDRNLPYQQPPGPFPLPVVLFVASSNKLVDLEPLIPLLLDNLELCIDGRLIEIQAPDRVEIIDREPNVD